MLEGIDENEYFDSCGQPAVGDGISRRFTHKVSFNYTDSARKASGRIERDDRQPPQGKGGVPAAEVVPQGRMGSRFEGPARSRRRSGEVLGRASQGTGLDQEMVEGPPMASAFCQMVRRWPDQRLAELPGSSPRLPAAE